MSGSRAISELCLFTSPTMRLDTGSCGTYARLWTSAAHNATWGPLFPLRPNTRKLRVAVDLQTIGQPTRELLRVLSRDEEVDPLLLVQNDEPEPTEWMQTLGTPRWYQFTFTTVSEAPKFADSSTVGILGYEDGERTLATWGTFQRLRAP